MGDLVIAAYISCDFYFFFESSVIASLQQTKQFKGNFWYSTSEESNEVFRMDLLIEIFDPRQDPQKGSVANVKINFEDNLVSFFITDRDFHDWFISPSEQFLKYGPSQRLAGSAHLYLKTPQSLGAEGFKKALINFIVSAEIIQAW